MPIVLKTPIVVPASTVTTPAMTYDTLKLLSFRPTLHPSNGKRDYEAEVCPAAMQPNGSYVMLRSHVQKIKVEDVAANGTAPEQVLMDQLEDLVALRYAQPSEPAKK